MKKEKGFTLIELLAVIIILTIIALISVPLILNIIEKARKSAFQNSAYGIMESARLYYVENIIDNKELGDKVFSYEEEENELKYKGTRPKGGTIIVKSNGKIEMSIYNEKWCAIKREDKESIEIINYNKETCKIESPMIEEGIKLSYIESGLDSAIPGSYYNIRNQKGIVTCINLSDENREVTNTSELKEGENSVKCRMTYENKEIASLTRTFKIDATIPTITSPYINEAYSMTEKTSVEVDTLYNVTFGGMGGNVTCKNGDTVVTNLNTLALGSYTLTCTATGKNGKTATISPKVTVESEGTSGSDLAENDNLPNVGNGYRYQGANPNNFVTFNGEAYRIIGVFNGQMKLIYWGSYTAEGSQYLTGIVWDTSGSNSSNKWAKPSALNTTLNTAYWESLNATAQAMVDQNHNWGIGGISSNYTLSNFYNNETSKTWTGKVGLMTVADYGYASSDSSCTDNLNLYNNPTCKNDNWLFTSSHYQWTIIPNINTVATVWTVFVDGYINDVSVAQTSFSARPVIYLNSSVKIKSGTGTENDPYILTK